MTTPARIVVGLTAVSPQRDAALLRDWLVDPRSAAWGMGDLAVEAVEAYLDAIDVDSAQQAWLGLITGVPSFYVETYDPTRVLLVDTHLPAPGDLGMHVLVSPPGETHRPGLTDAIFIAVMSWCFDELGATRVVVEPDVLNVRIRAKNVRAGFEELRQVVIDEGDQRKTAMLSVCTRSGFANSDLVRGARQGRA